LQKIAGNNTASLKALYTTKHSFKGGMRRSFAWLKS